VIAPGRARRPGAAYGTIDPATDEELEACPFCQGREDRTPPEVLALGREKEEPDTPGWIVRVVPNLYPAFERQEVVVHSPRHVRSFAELGDEEIALVTQAWRARADAGRREELGYLHAIVNEGRAAGASLAHSHSQLVWIQHEPPLVEGEHDGSCRLCSLLREIGAGSTVIESGALVLFCPPAGRAPYELMIAPKDHERDAFESERLEPALAHLRQGIRLLCEVEGPVPWNAWIHTGSHWHLEVVPRLTVFAGIELGAGIYVNPLPAAEAAARLRGAG
jgi:UDPglucose--hexose-1-phosphate uridylyltransferase